MYKTYVAKCTLSHDATNTCHDATNFTVDRMFRDTKHWISRKRSLTFPGGEKIFNCMSETKFSEITFI